MKKNHYISKLNKNDFLMFALDNVITSLGQVLTFRFTEKHSTEEIRSATRFMLTIYPRLRSIVEPTLLSYRLRIIDDNNRKLNVLFNDAFRVKNNLLYESEEFVDYRRNLLNEPFSLQQGLPIKIHYIPDDPKPVLLLSIHHMICDGISWYHLGNSLLSYLNGNKPPSVPLESHSQLPALLRKPYYGIPIKIYKSFIQLREDMRMNKGLKVISASSRPVDFFGPSDMSIHLLSYDFNSVKMKAKELNVFSVNVLMITALAMAISQGPGKDNGDVIAIPFSIDLRQFFDKQPPVFGNYVSTFWLRIHKKYLDNPKQILEVVKTQFYQNIKRFKDNTMLVPMTFEKFQTLVGTKYYALGAKIAFKKGLISMSCNFSTLGSLDMFNSHGTRAKVCECMSGCPQHGLFMFYATIDNKFFIGFTYPEAEFTRKEIDHLIKLYEIALGQLLQI
ncbi:MAG: hypothetical protein JXB49_34935 [Bacteroidales bacterium]|nr:hypothetical protein [Bacteroidales bacterium]